MRLIDADKLLASVQKNAPYLHIIMAAIVALAPTEDAEPVRHGWWIERETEKPLILRCVMCSECGTMYQRRWKSYLNFCPNCSAKMDGDQQ